MAVKASATITLSAVTDIESVWWYYKLQSSTLNPPAKPTTNPPPSGWTDAEPAYTPGSTNTLYFVELTVFSDGTFDYGSVSVSSSYEAAKAAWNKAQAVDERVSVAETAIEQTQQAIQLRATKTEVQTVATAASNAQSAADAAQSAADSAQEGADFATPYISAEPPETAPAAGKMWVDTGVTPEVWRRWRGTDVGTEREYTETISGGADSPAALTLDNAQGQIESVAVEAGCRAKQEMRKNLFPSLTSAVTVRGLTVSPQADGTVVISGTATGQATVYTYTGTLPDGQYTISGGTYNAVVALIAVDANNQWKRTIGSSRGNPGTFNFNGLLDGEYRVRMIIQTANDSAGQTFDNVVLSPQLEAGGTATAFEPYRSMGGGTVTPSEPLYGLSGAEDTVEVSVDGDVTVTRRTAVLELDGTENWVRSPKNNHGYYYRLSVANIFQITTSVLPNIICSHYQTETPNAQWGGTHSCISQNYNANMRTEVQIYDANYAESDLATWKSYLAAQYAAGTPVTIVYELAAPETEALTAISPIAPQPGQLNLFTDADALTATIHGSGWETVNDTNDIRTALADVDSNVAGLIASMGLLEGTVAQIGEQMITPEGIVSIVAESDGYQALVNMANQSAEDFELVQTTITNINGRVEKLEEGVHVEGSNVGLYSSGSPFRMDLDHAGISITENGQPTITVRESRADIPRIMTETLIIGGFAYRAGENDLYQMII